MRQGCYARCASVRNSRLSPAQQDIRRNGDAFCLCIGKGLTHRAIQYLHLFKQAVRLMEHFSPVID
jgi:hypothetical protein